ncbi:MAG: ABC transporter permease [Trueperaceae bacterium]|nr:ABC transporter permease [Trueperaceae bacterium]
MLRRPPKSNRPDPRGDRARGDRRAVWLASPAALWLIVFFLLPLVFVLIASFLTRGGGGLPVWPPTLAHYERTFTVFAPVLWRTLGFALLTTGLCLGIGYPTAVFIARRRRANVRMLLLFLVLLPFWTNFLVRTYALITIVQREGLLNGLLLQVGAIAEPLQLLFTQGAVVLGLVYGYLPFMVLPIYASVERLDRRYVEAAHDLGANDWRAFWRVVWPLTLPGVVAGSMLVFIPAVGAFVTPDLMGGTRGLMIGNLVQSQFSGRGNVPLGSAVSMVLLVVVFVGVLVYTRFGEQER